MQTHLADSIQKTEAGQYAESILRNCVHCGFCNATCPTYQLLGNELDGPRGRIYLIKQMLEGQAVTRKTQVHLDRCLTCLNCETTCPSGVKYHKLLEIGREHAEEKISRPWLEQLQRKLLRFIVPHPERFRALLKLGRLSQPFLPAKLKLLVPKKSRIQQEKQISPSPSETSGTILLFSACVQNELHPETHHASVRVLKKLGYLVKVIKNTGCCGALHHHMSNKGGLDFMRRNIDAWWPHIEAGATAIAITASGCSAMLKEYGELLADDPDYAEKAKQVASLSKDLSQIIADADLDPFTSNPSAQRIAFHPPCSLQHAQQLSGVVENILEKTGYELLPVTDSHLCCGSAGSYSILLPTIANALKENKLKNLEKNQPDLIATANIGCQQHLQTNASIPVIHWIELLDKRLNGH